MTTRPPGSADSLVTAAEIARMAKVTRAAVTNWRRRHVDFPAPAGGGGSTALFKWSEVEAWLGRHEKGDERSSEVVLWQALRGTYPDDIVRGLADVAELLADGSSDAPGSDLRPLVLDLAGQSSPVDVLGGLIERFVGSAAREVSGRVSTPRLVRAVRHFTGQVTGTIFDPACGVGSLLLSFSGDPGIELVAQEANAPAARLAATRAGLTKNAHVTVRVGDSLQHDQWPEVRADLVVCDPPVESAGWGREDLLMDGRWAFGVPTRAEGELAWLQHCYAHVAPGGRAVVAMSPSAGYRKSGRRIRAELVRRGVLTSIVALPAGMAVSHLQPVHLWVLTRPAGAESDHACVRLVDLTGNDPDGSLEPAANQLADVSLIDLLDEDVDLTPSRHVTASHTDQLAEYTAACAALAVGLDQLRDLLPPLGSGPGALDSPMVRVADLARAGIVAISGRDAVSTSDRLDTDYLLGFLHSAANLKRATSGSFRADVRGARIPKMGIEDQRAYGAAFRAIDDFERRLADLTKLGARAAAMAREGLTYGALRPDEPERSR